MRRLFLLLIVTIAMATTANAQSYTQHLQERKPGQGSVTITQSKDIDQLVNSTDVSAQKKEPVGTNTNKTTSSGNTATNNATATTNKTTNTPQHNDPHKTGHEPTGNTHNSSASTTHPSNESVEKEEPIVDTHKKVMRRSYKVNGYRVQVFAGGNSRADKENAQRAGVAVKRAMPDQPVYVHFYSPRWICRVGNYRSYEEANNVLRQVQKLGYKQACIVSGKITVAY